jgi:hypothetical protein
LTRAAAGARSRLAVLEEFHLAEPPFRFLESPIGTAEIPSLARQHLIAFLHFNDHERLLMDRNQRIRNLDREDVSWITPLVQSKPFQRSPWDYKFTHVCEMIFAAHPAAPRKQ